MANFTTLLNYFEAVQSKNPSVSSKSLSSYISHLINYDKANGGNTYNQITTIIKKKSSDPIADAMFYFSLIASKMNPKTASNYKVAYNLFCETIIGRYDGNVWISYILSLKTGGSKKYSDVLYELIAQSAIFASPEVVKKLMSATNPHACWYNNPSYIRDQKNKDKPTTDRNGISCIGDNNTKANQAIKRALLQSYSDINIAPIASFVNYTACHIVQNSTDDVNYYTSIPNIVLLPSAIAGLSDFLPDVQALLDYHAFQLYGLAYKSKPTLNSNLMKIYKSLNWRVNY